MSNPDDFWTTLAAGHTNTVLSGAMDTHLSGKSIEESFGSVRNLTDRVRAANALSLPVEAGTKVVFAGGMGSYLSYDDVPADGAAGEVVTVKSATGEITHHDGRVFVKWDDGQLRTIHAEHLRLASTGKQASRLDLRERHYYVVLSGKAKLWGDGGTSIGGWSGEKGLKKGDILRFIGWRAGDWGPSQPIFESERLGVKGFFDPTSGGMDTNPHPRALRYYAKESSGNRQASVIRVASLGDLTQFLKRADGKLVHKSTNDLWSYSKDADGNFLVERLFDDNGEPLQG